MSMKITRTQTLTYGEHGLQSSVDDLYVNLAGAFQPLLKQLKGAPLSFMLAIGIHEADIILRNAEPLTIPAISGATGYSRRAVIYAADYLCEHHFVDEARNSKRERTFRPAGYIWFGGKRFTPEPKEVDHAKIAYQRPLDTDAKNNAGVCKKGPRYAKKRVKGMQPPVVVDGTDIQSNESEKEQQQPEGPKQNSAARAILRGAGIFGKPLDELTGVDEETAEIWAEWIKQPGPGIYRPQGIAVNALREDPHATPPGYAPEPARKFHAQGKFAAATVLDLARLAMDCGPQSLLWKDFVEAHGLSPDEFISGASRDNSTVKEE